MRKRNLVVSLIMIMMFVFTACSVKTSKQGIGLFSDAAKLLTEVKTTQFFADENIEKEDVEKILSAGVNAPSAMNTQPWHFTAVTDKEVANKLADAMKNMKPPVMKDGKGFMPKGEGRMEPPADAPNPPEGGKDFMPKGEGKMKPPAGAPNPPKGGKGFAMMPNKAGIGDAPLTIVISCKEGSELDAGLAVQNMSAEAQLLGYGTKIMTAPTMALNNDEYKEMLSVPEGQKIVAVLVVGKIAEENEEVDAVSSASVRNDFNEVVTVIGE